MYTPEKMSSGRDEADVDCQFGRAAGSLVVRASDCRPEGLGSMPDATKYPHSTHGVGARLMRGSESLVS
ncbi:hypothetical protein TNCV_490281 [Trichonephila clavipes]|nr:hypothetical protein TNCV_490281 [Trichonephila clavipes]